MNVSTDTFSWFHSIEYEFEIDITFGANRNGWTEFGRSLCLLHYLCSEIESTHQPSIGSYELLHQQNGRRFQPKTWGFNWATLLSTGCSCVCFFLFFCFFSIIFDAFNVEEFVCSGLQGGGPEVLTRRATMKCIITRRVIQRLDGG